MTLPISGITANYTDPGSGVEVTNAWIQIRQINYIPEVSVLVVCDVYKNYESYVAKLSPIFFNILPTIASTDPAFEIWFTIAVMAQSDHDMLTEAMGYLMSIYPPV